MSDFHVEIVKNSRSYQISVNSLGSDAGREEGAGNSEYTFCWFPETPNSLRASTIALIEFPRTVY